MSYSSGALKGAGAPTAPHAPGLRGREAPLGGDERDREAVGVGVPAGGGFGAAQVPPGRGGGGEEEMCSPLRDEEARRRVQHQRRRWAVANEESRGGHGGALRGGYRDGAGLGDTRDRASDFQGRPSR